MEDRWRALAEPLRLGGLGLEIAPYFNPLIDKGTYDVRYVDCIDNDAIARKAAKNPGATGREVPRIDWVWTPGKPLRSCIPADIEFDYAVATHVMEHVPDPIGWLNQIFAVMRTGGVLALALPDRRFTMDYYRHETSLGEVLGNWLLAPATPTSTQIIDFVAQSFTITAPMGSASTPPSRSPRPRVTTATFLLCDWLRRRCDPGTISMPIVPCGLRAASRTQCVAWWTYGSSTR